MENVETFFCMINFVEIANFFLQRYFKLLISILTDPTEGCFFSYRPSSGIAPCVGTIGMVHMTPTLDAALLYVVHRDGVTYNTCLFMLGLTTSWVEVTKETPSWLKLNKFDFFWLFLDIENLSCSKKYLFQK